MTNFQNQPKGENLMLAKASEKKLESLSQVEPPLVKLTPSLIISVGI